VLHTPPRQQARPESQLPDGLGDIAVQVMHGAAGRGRESQAALQAFEAACDMASKTATCATCTCGSHV
jgi:hypothetical protein